MTFDEKRKMIGQWLGEADGGKLWDLLCALRGPDSPSERPDLPGEQQRSLYAARRKRKFDTVEVIREKAFFGAIGGAARHHDADHVTLPPQSQWDHFDKHVARAAETIGLAVRKRPEVKKGLKVTIPKLTKRVLTEHESAAMQAEGKGKLVFAELVNGAYQHYTFEEKNE